ncbi:hypothetical protein [Sphingobium yanoikuyae]|jgi:hypothetical protein|uniref:hypothetical protein n=1 Tax=Sphingobium yanoikuyae TaxID=13690 RepID=UPI00137785E6|nr:hypothetical protein [Sphingobium yanoikuyae]NBB39610.1 hypothetical protein [Sphingobium yanoikuyae]
MYLDLQARTGARKAVTLRWTGAQERQGSASATASALAGAQTGPGGGAANALAAEEDCLWEARIAARWLGAYEGEVVAGEEWDLVAILKQVEGGWFAARMLVDGEGAPRQVTGRRNLESKWRALRAFQQWR